MRTQGVFIPEPALSRELLAQPIFADGTLRLVKRFSTNHSRLLEYLFQSPDRKESLIVKQQPMNSDAERLTLQEFENLRGVRRMLGDALARTVPEPLLALPKQGILVTTKVPGKPFAGTLKKYANRFTGPFHTSAMCDKARRVGAWLLSFQSATRAEPLTYSVPSYLADLEMRMSQFAKKGFEPDVIREILGRASLQSAGLNGRLVPAAGRHGDFIAQNILIDPDGISTVDFEGFSEREIIYDDPGMFLGYVFVLGARVPYSPQSLEAVRRGFLSGFLAGDAIEQALLNTYILKGAVRIIADGPRLAENWSRLGAARMLTKGLMRLASGIT